MRRSSLLWIVLVCSALTAAGEAQGVVNLQGGAGQTVTFTGMGAGTSTLGVSLGNCGFFNTCVLYGNGSGSGALSSSGVFLITSSPGSLELTSNSGGSFDVESSAPVEFPFFGVAGSGQMGLLLAGNLNLADFTQTGANSGVFGAGGGSLTVTGGILAGAAANATLGLNLGLQFTGSANLGGLVGTNNSLSANLSGGRLGALSPTPEPSSLLLAGLGLLLLVATCGWRRRGQASLV